MGEVAKRRLRQRRGVAPWAWVAWTLGAVLCAVHMALAMAVRHAWSHDAAVAETARQTAAVFGVNWGGGVYVNYLFTASWLAESWWWRVNSDGYARMPKAVLWTLRAFYFTVIVNAAIVFASPARRMAGALLAIVLLWTWRPAEKNA